MVHEVHATDKQLSFAAKSSFSINRPTSRANNVAGATVEITAKKCWSAGHVAPRDVASLFGAPKFRDTGALGARRIGMCAGP